MARYRMALYKQDLVDVRQDCDAVNVAIDDFQMRCAGRQPGGNSQR